MSTLNWLDENQHRHYPFTVDAPDGAYLASLADAVFVLGQDYAYDLDQELEELRLVSVAVSGGSVWTFRHYRDGLQVLGSPDLVISVPENPERHSTWSGSTPGGYSYGYITLGDPTQIVNSLAINAPLEDRVVLAYGAATSQRIRVFNTVPASTYRPFFTADPAKSPAQNYLDAVANSLYGGSSTHYLVTTPGTTITGDLVFLPGYNSVVAGDAGGNRVTLELSPGAGAGRDCSTPVGVGFAGTLRGMNGQAGVRGDLWLTAGQDFEVVLDQDNYKVTLRLKALSDAVGCGKAVTQREPAAISGPP